MKANPDTFQAIAIGPKTNKHNLSLDLKGNKITCDENVKPLGINQYQNKKGHCHLHNY
jgi:hypothetical protein